MAKNIHEEFLSLLGWEGEELESFLPQWIYAARFLRLSDRDVENAVESWLPKYWDLSLLSIRKLIAAYIREVVEFSKVSQFKN